MSPTSSQQWSRRIRYSDQHLRVSDAERSAVAERLATHYSDGRLDQAEFDERVGQAMAAKTRGDLDGLFDDLPDPEAAGASRNARPGDPAIPHRRRRSGFGRMLLLVVLAIVALSIVSHVLTAFAFAFPWFWIAALVAVVLLVNRSAHHRHDR
ncbi:MAG TPA: DUF1707 domain-containing protein [Trebonia sp.]|jgi:hypothetical protein|nr:DUF1707 domain-containing protein [Trebonia sp.]